MAIATSGHDPHMHAAHAPHMLPYGMCVAYLCKHAAAAAGLCATLSLCVLLHLYVCGACSVCVLWRRCVCYCAVCLCFMCVCVCVCLHACVFQCVVCSLPCMYTCCRRHASCRDTIVS